MKLKKYDHRDNGILDVTQWPRNHRDRKRKSNDLIYDATVKFLIRVHIYVRCLSNAKADTSDGSVCLAKNG